jgi:hypothetical protein
MPDIPKSTIDLMTDKNCGCNFVNWVQGHEADKVWILCAYYIWKTRYIAAWLPSTSHENLMKLSNHITGGNTGKEMRKTARKGYYCESFEPLDHIIDLVEINFSKPIRQKRPMDGSYLYTKDKLASYYQRTYQKGICPYHYVQHYGVFTKDKKLVGMVQLIRNGELCYYNRIIGHGDYLKDGIMYFLHFYIQNLIRSEDIHFKAIKGTVYGQWESKGKSQGLNFWKHKAGFITMQLVRVGTRAPEETDLTR